MTACSDCPRGLGDGPKRSRCRQHDPSFDEADRAVRERELERPYVPTNRRERRRSVAIARKGER